MNATERDKGLSSSAAAGHTHPPCLLWSLNSLVDQVLFISGICVASLPLVYYVFCYYYRGIEKATCRRQNSDLTIILAGTFLFLYLVKRSLQYFALRYTR